MLMSQESGCRAQGSGFRAHDLGFRIQGSGFTVSLFRILFVGHSAYRFRDQMFMTFTERAHN
jgi:hypothetical protein